MTPADKKVAQAKSNLILTNPFFATIALRVKWVNDPTCDTMWTDGLTIGYNPAFVDTLSLEEVKGVICHEVLHITNKHHLRRGNRNHKKWNEAADYAINPIIVAGGMDLPAGGLLDAEFNNMSAEGIFSKRQSEEQGNNDDNQDDQNQQDDSGDDQQDDSQSGSGDSDDSGDDQQNGDDAGTDSDDDQNGSGDGNDDGDSDSGSDDKNGNENKNGSGSGSGDSDDSQSGDSGCGEVRDYPGDPSDAEKSAAEHEVNVMIQQAANIASKAGKLSGNLKRMVEEALKPEVDWRAILADFLTEKVREDYTWKQPNRRYLSTGFILPSLNSDTLGKLVIYCDTSISIDQKALTRFVNEIREIVSQFNITIWVVYVDSKVAGYQEIAPGDDTDLQPMGGGGTDFRPGFEWVEENDIDPTVGIYYTDGECSDFPEEPDYPVLWALIEKPKYMEWNPPFGETIILD